MLRDALDRVAPAGRHAIVIGEALRNGGLLDMPSDRAAFKTFVEGPLKQAACSHLGKQVGLQLVDILQQMLKPGSNTLTGTLPLNAKAPPKRSGSQPSGNAVGSKTLGYSDKSGVESTLPYGGSEERSRLDAAIIEDDLAIHKRITDVLERRDYRVLTPTVDNLVSVCQQLSVQLVFVGTAHDAVLEKLSVMGSDGPSVVFISDEITKRPKGVVAILKRDFEDHLLEALDAALRYGR